MRGGVNMASIKDVAQKAGVGVGTVSRVLNNSGYVSDETREKIEEAMKNLQYTPNELARNLYHKKSGIIAVLVPTVEIPFFAELVHDIEAELYNEGFKIMLCNTDKAPAGSGSSVQTGSPLISLQLLKIFCQKIKKYIVKTVCMSLAKKSII